MAQEALVTLYLKGMSVNIEVALHREQSKMSIASSVHAQALFGEEPLAIPFRERISLLNSMMEKFFVISEGAVYHLKVESEAAPIEAWLDEKRRETSLKNPREHRAREYDVIENAQAISEIQDNKERFATAPNGTRYCRCTSIDGEVHELELIFHRDPASKKKDAAKAKGGGRQNKKLSTYGKS